MTMKIMYQFVKVTNLVRSPVALLQTNLPMRIINSGHNVTNKWLKGIGEPKSSLNQRGLDPWKKGRAVDKHNIYKSWPLRRLCILCDKRLLGFRQDRLYLY